MKARAAPPPAGGGLFELLGRFDRRLALLLAAAVVLVYLPAFSAGYIWDDDYYVQHNETVQSIGGLWKIWFDVGVNQQYYPLVHTSFWLEARIWGDDPSGFHVVNALLHALGAVLAYRVLARLSVPGAWLAAAIWALHPVQVESVAWITERKNVLSAVFYFASALCYLDWEDSRKKPRKYALALFFFACALFCKTVTLTLPAALLLVRWWKSGRLKFSDVKPLLPFLAIGIPMGLLTVWVERVYVGAGSVDFGLEPLDRLLIAGRAPWFYLSNLVAPLHLAFIHPRWEIDPSAALQWLFPIATVGFLGVLFALRGRIGRGPLTAMLFFGGTLFPALGFVDVFPFLYSFVADHFQYLAGLGPIALFSALLTQRLQRSGSEAVALGVIGLLLASLGFLTWRQQAAYHDLETLWKDTLAKNPGAWIAHTNLGNLLLEDGQQQQAIEHYEEAIRLNPELVEARQSLASAHLTRGEHAAAIPLLREALALLPDALDEPANSKIPWMRQSLHGGLGAALRYTGEMALAREHLELAVAAEPDNVLEYFNLGALDFLQGRNASAIARFERALELDPNAAVAAKDLAWIYATVSDPDLRDPERAVELARRGVQLTRNSNPVQLFTLSVAYSSAGSFEQAADAARGALRILAAGGPPKLAAEVQRALRLYEAGRAYSQGN